MSYFRFRFCFLFQTLVIPNTCDSKHLCLEKETESHVFENGNGRITGWIWKQRRTKTCFKIETQFASKENSKQKVKKEAFIKKKQLFPFFEVRLGAESNCHLKICNPVHYHYVTQPEDKPWQNKEKNSFLYFASIWIPISFFFYLETERKEQTPCF